VTSGADSREHVSSFELDLLEAGALDESREKGVKEHLRVCADCRERHASLKALHGEFTSEVLPRTATTFQRRSSPTKVPLLRRPIVWAPVLASAAALVLAIRFGTFEQRPSTDGPDILLKGGTALSIVARRNGAPLPVETSFVQLRAGDELRFVAVSDERARHLLIVAVDGSGKTSVYFPFAGDASGAMGSSGRWEVPGSVILDASPGPERIFALFSAEPLDARPVLEQLNRVGAQGAQAIRRSARLPLAGVEQHSLLIEKSVSASP
jgi:hypothetical protein